MIVIVITESNLTSCGQCKTNASGFKKKVRGKLDTPMHYADTMHIQLLITKGQCNTNCNFAFHYNANLLILLKKTSYNRGQN